MIGQFRFYYWYDFQCLVIPAEIVIYAMKRNRVLAGIALGGTWQINE